MSSTLFSVDFGNYDDPNSSTQKLKEAVQGVSTSLTSPNLADYFPILRIIDPQGLKKRAEFCFGKLLAIFEDLINQRLESRQNGSPKKNDLLEALLDQREQYDISLKEIKYILFDLFVAGADPTSGVVDWVMTELLLNPKEMSNVKNELRSVIGDNKQVEESDISRLPYLQAVIKEVFRYHPPGPLLIPHRAEADIEINGFMIPKNTDFFINLWSMGRDSSLWPNPDSFEPGRFINRKIDFMGTNYELLPFGSGRRICPGLPLANRMLHLMMAALLHNFNWKLEPGMTAQELDVSDKFVLSLRRVVPLKAVPYKL
ncbi:hypothetical protein BUALT_Bualt15G0065200 [Buddleja alternifolia]|uniref:Cytochrome P450 76AD1-like protein n=1 Tax=Buddleja alternifolia TaxID=168488 RepID=A0AAV6WKV7_9LAMI|nr:hypothetical protein BUALT_Bualt15G0065200 [Buddleja alternifolia]